MALQPISYEHAGVSLNGVLGLPDKIDRKRPGILVIHAADGITAGIETRLSMLNELGFVAFAADLYGGSRPLAGPAIGEAMMALRADHQHFRARVRAAFDLLYARPEVDAKRTAAIGYCLGGMAVLEMARDGAPVAGVVSFHGVLTTPLPAKPGAVKARVLVCTGARDPYATKADVDALQDELTAAGANWQIISYGHAEHSFASLGLPDVDMPGIAYEASADRQSWAAMQAFFREIFNY